MTRDNYCLRCNRTITIGEWYCDTCLPIYQEAAAEETRKDEKLTEDGFTSEELAAIRSLERLARKWPKTLTLLSMDAGLYITRTADQDVIATRDGCHADLGVPMIPIYGIPNDGGAW